MARLTSVRQIWTFILGYGGSLLALGIAPAVAMRMLHDHPHASTAHAISGVLVGTLGVVPVVLLLLWMYRRSDEYERHGMLLVTGIAFALALVVMTALDYLAFTDLLPAWVWLPRWVTVTICWVISLIAVRVARGRHL